MSLSDTTAAGGVSIEGRVTQLVQASLPRPFASTTVQPGHRLRDELGLDSLGLMSLAFRLEDEFGLQLAEHADELGRAATVTDLFALVRSLLSR